MLPWDVVLQRMPWNVLFLVGGGLALSLAYKESNLSHAIATAFTVRSHHLHRQLHITYRGHFTEPTQRHLHMAYTGSFT